MSWWRRQVLLLIAASSENAPLWTVPDFDAQHHLGTWHEIAVIPDWSQRQCASDTKAVDTPVADPGEIGSGCGKAATTRAGSS